MNETQQTLQTPDNFTLHTVSWMPEEGIPKAIILLVHGIAEHIGRYQHLASYFVDKGYGVYGIDHRSHGKSSGETRAYFDDFVQSVDDLELFFNQITATHPNHKIYVYGHSMGSLISLMLTLRRQAEIAGLISTGTPINVDELASPLLYRVGKLLQRIAPKMSFGKIAPELLSHDPDVINHYKNDPLNFVRPARIHMIAEIIDRSREVRKELMRLRLPLLLLHGEADQICPPSGSQFIFEKAGSPDKTLKFYPNLYHEIHNEPEKDAVFSDILEWLNHRI